MASLEYYVVHCTDTPFNRKVTKQDLDVWHMAPKKMPDGRIKYLGKTYASLKDAPIKPIHEGRQGNGWDRYGYRLIIHRDGTKTILTPVDDDQWVSNEEMTWGSAGINGKSVHVVLEGGWPDNSNRASELMDFYDLFTEQQAFVLAEDFRNFLSKHPQVKVSGHNKHSKKLCPGFDVGKFFTDLGLREFILL